MNSAIVYLLECFRLVPVDGASRNEVLILELPRLRRRLRNLELVQVKDVWRARLIGD